LFNFHRKETSLREIHCFQNGLNIFHVNRYLMLNYFIGESAFNNKKNFRRAILFTKSVIGIWQA